MIKSNGVDKCFQCGKDLIVVKTYTEIINNSKVTTTKSNCSDPVCRKSTQEFLRKERDRINEAMNNKKYPIFNPRNSGKKAN